MTLLIQARENDKNAMESIIVKFNPKLQKSLYQTTQQDRNDLKQEIHLKIIEAVYKYDLETVPGLWEFIHTKEDEDMLLQPN
ncbi:helix-turn-helix domain-containing protein [Paenibacillus sp. LS1]|uniref:helix-turn-helix domain-containing protein n=1 Tax=Paenibacillus sp. LS1 TaxID=2992120 RepID=UPI002230BB4D|nr:helix-turn-helix domain-containing protein [Paenibacillus sp. LS1]MCW3793769.1 helix-turn-helix domain-containing protein [Paenibacillus sp. LS1]